LYALMARPMTFGYGLMESPTIWVGMGQLIRDTSPLVAYPRKAYMGFGAAELGEGKNAEKGLALLDKVVANFRAAGYDENSFRYVLEPDAKHTESAWAKRLPDALKFLFADWKPAPQADEQ
jgi:predicted alpha/beta superfamily hydrolase